MRNKNLLLFNILYDVCVGVVNAGGFKDNKVKNFILLNF